MSTDIDTTVDRESLSPQLPQAVIDECEADGSGTTKSVTTILLTASECPVGCNMCDLWHKTLVTPTPPGAIPQQIDHALSGRPPADWIKLYNSGNFFDPRSVPPDDYPAIAKLCASFSRVVVENHPMFGASRLKTFRDLLLCQLEVAVGLETVQPRWLDRLEKQMSRDIFDRYAGWLRIQGVDLRVFLIIGVPGVTVKEAIRWARLSLRHAVTLGARHISLIPARSGHGWNDRAAELPVITPLDLLKLQRAAIDDSDGRAVVTVDLWDADQTVSDEDQKFLQQLAAMNLSQQAALP